VYMACGTVEWQWVWPSACKLLSLPGLNLVQCLNCMSLMAVALPCTPLVTWSRPITHTRIQYRLGVTFDYTTRAARCQTPFPVCMPVLTDPVGIAKVGNTHVPHAWHCQAKLASPFKGLKPASCHD